MFIVHGEACRKDQQHPTCSQDRYSSNQGRMFSLDIKGVMGNDWRVRALCAAS